MILDEYGIAEAILATNHFSKKDELFIVAKYLRINEIIEIIQKKISMMIYNQESINNKFLNKINSNNINEAIKKRT